MNSEMTAPGPFRRLGAIFYDTLLMVALLFVVSALFLLVTGGESVANAPLWVRSAYRAALLVVWIGFFAIFWRGRGQTLGMQVWRIMVVRPDGQPLSLKDVVLRLLAASTPLVPGLIVLGVAEAFGIVRLRSIGAWLLLLVLVNYAAAWLDPQRRALHDRFLTTKIVRVK
jgi:uncharacterized RDD family membrane protein YckC